MLRSAPESYGLNEAATLAHRVGAAPPAQFEAFWRVFRDELAVLTPAWRGRIDGEVNTVILTSIRSVRITVRVTVPETTPRAVVVTTHGYAPPESFPPPPEPWTDQGVATVRLRVRGFPPSTTDVPDRRDEWILHNVHAADDWVLRSPRRRLPRGAMRARQFDACPVFLHGESFGGGLAVIAAAQLAEAGDPVERLVIGLPSLGDWTWRRDRYCNGAGRLINETLCAMRDKDAELQRTLLLFDAALHAPRVEIPALCKLATRDDVVPAPSAAAVFNALGSSRRWRFVTRYGHYDGGLANARRHAAFERLHRAFLDPARRPYEVMHDPPLPLELAPERS